MEQYKIVERKAAKDYAPSLLKLWQEVRPSSIYTMIKSDSPNLATIKNKASLCDAQALISLAICEVCEFYNVKQSMNDVQIAMTADVILERFWYLKLEEIKKCFRDAVVTEKVYERLDGSVFLGWLLKYDMERTDIAMQISENEAKAQIAESEQLLIGDGTPHGTYSDYKQRVLQRVEQEDAKAKEELEQIKIFEDRMARSGKTRDDKGFREYFVNVYIPSKFKKQDEQGLSK